MKAYVDKAVPLKGADTISIMLTVPKSDWPEVSKLVMQDVEISLAAEQSPAEPDTVEAIEQRMTAALAEAALCGRKLAELAKRPAVEGDLFVPVHAGNGDSREKP